MKRILSIVVTIIKQLIYLPIRIKFNKCGKWVTFGKLNRIVGGKCIVVGDYCSFGNNLRLEAIQRFVGGDFHPFLVIGNKVAINQNFHCTCASSIMIGDGTSITANCGIFDIIHPYEDININPREAQIQTKPISIGKDCLIGMNSVILPGTQLGNHCIVGANSTVLGVFPDYCVIAGSPAKMIKRFDFTKNKWIKV